MRKNAIAVTIKRHSEQKHGRSNFEVTKVVNTTEFLPGQFMSKDELDKNMRNKTYVKNWIIT